MAEKKHEQVKREIIRWIERGDLASGDRVPTENDLVDRFGVSKSPIRQALAELSAEGYIYTVQGSGSYVTDVSGTLIKAPLTIHALMYTDADIEQEIMLGMHAALRARRDPGIRLAFQHPGADEEALIARLRSFNPDAPEALALIPVLGGGRDRHRRLAAALRALQESGWCVVQVDHLVPDFEGTAVMSDHAAGARMLTEHLLEHGHRSIAVLLNHPDRSSIRERLAGVRAALAAHDVELSPSAVLEYDEAGVRAEGSELLKRIDALGASAVISFENEGGAALLDVLESAGLSVPDDLSLATFDNRAFERTHPGFVTHVRQPLARIGRRVMEITLEAMLHTRDAEVANGRETDEAVERLAPELVVGASTACYPTATPEAAKANAES